jgi:hypothetical protein
VGNGGQSLIEYRAHFALWCLMKAPLIIGFKLGAVPPTCLDCDKAKAGAEIFEILLNRALIAVNQDALGSPVSETVAQLACPAAQVPPAAAGRGPLQLSVWAGVVSGDGAAEAEGTGGRGGNDGEWVLMLHNDRGDDARNQPSASDPMIDCPGGDDWC